MDQNLRKEIRRIIQEERAAFKSNFWKAALETALLTVGMLCLGYVAMVVLSALATLVAKAWQLSSESNGVQVQEPGSLLLFMFVPLLLLWWTVKRK